VSARVRWCLLYRLLLAACLLTTCMTRNAAAIADKIDWRAEPFLQEDPARPVLAALVSAPKGAEQLARALGLKQYGIFHYIDTVITRAPASRLLEWQERDDVVLIDPIVQVMESRVTNLLTEIYRIVLYRHLGTFHPAVLNLSIGVPREWLNQGLTADRVVHRAIEYVVGRLEIPVVMSAGNDGPVPGLVNPWALARGVLIAGATDAQGTRLWSRSSRFAQNSSQAQAFFVAHGENTIGALPLGQQKTAEQLTAERDIDLAAIVGPEHVAHYSVASGTSFAAATLSRAICLVHQAIATLKARASTNAAVGTATLEPFVRAYIDSGFDRRHPVFANRLADERRHFGPPSYPLTAQRKQQFWNLLVGNAIDLNMRYSPASVEQVLGRSARPVKGLDQDAVGAGFVSWQAIAETLRDLKMSDLVDLFGDAADPQTPEWRRALVTAGDPPVFDASEVDRFDDYCQKYDLVLGLRLSGPQR
jgi:hypothetical protein